MVRRLPRALASASLVLTACGLLPSPSPAPPVPSDGVASFGDASPIELCIGTAHVVSPDASGGAGAVCVSAGGHGAPCSSDAACTGIESCVCGRCIVTPCAVGALCPQGQVCADNRCTKACATDADCGAGGTCDAGGCTRACSNDAACQYGERCDPFFGVCVTKLCSDAPCATSDACEAEAVTGALHEPEVVTVGGTPVGYVELRAPGAPSAIYRARIDGPGRWTADPATPVLGGEAPGAGAPSVLVDGAEVEMYFAVGAGKAIAHARSSDGGRTFVPDDAQALVPVAAWEAGWIGSPAAARFQGATLLFYEGGPGAGVGLARVVGGIGTRVGTGPIASPATVTDPIFWRDVTQVGAPYAVVAGDVLRVYFTGRGVWGSDALVGGATVPADPTDAIGLTASLDAMSFVPYPSGPVYARVINLRSYLGQREAAVQLLPGVGAQITFVSTDATGASEAGLAQASSQTAPQAGTGGSGGSQAGP